MKDRSDNLKINPESSNEKRQPFIEDFNMEHSSSYAAGGPRVATSAGSASRESAPTRSSYSQNQHSPNCVYLG